MSKHDEDMFEVGLGVRRDMFGPGGAEQQIAQATDFTRPMQELATRYCFGEIWGRPGLDRKTRSMLTMALMVALGKPNQLKLHVKGAIANGVTKDEIREVLLHSMIYAGIAAGAEAHAVAAETLREMGLE
ncbi:MAG: carboxymuconolactone decarboxylase family protein [Candidatus Binatia bacterium]